MRPFSLVGLCYLLTLAAAVYFGAAPSLLPGSACLAVFCVLVLWKRTERMRILQAAALTCALAFGAFSACARAQVLPSEKLDGRDAVMTGTVCELPARSYGRFYYVVRVENISLPGAPRVEKVRLSSQNALNADCYGTITGRVHFYTPRGEDGFSSRSYYASKGITLFAYLYEYENVRTSPAREKPPYYYALMLRRSMTDSLYRLLPPEQAGLAAGILLGDTGGISDEVKSDFKTVGISHILSVSGLHMAAMAQFFLLLFGLLRVPRRLSAGMTMAGVVSFMAVTGFAPSVLRSGIMCLIFLLGTVLDRQADSLNSLGIAALLIGVANPFAAADLGLLLSFSATLGMILCSGRLTAFLRARYEGIKRGRAVLDAVNSAVSTTVSATAFTLPVVVLSFGTVSLISPAANLLEVFPSSLLMAFSAAAALCYLVGLRFLALPLALFSGLLANWMSACARMLARIPWASVSASYGFVRLWLAAVLVLCALALAWKKSPPARVLSLLSAVVLLCGIFSYQLSMRRVTRVAVLDAGDGISVALTHAGRGALIGCGGYSSAPARSYLNGQNITVLDYLQTTGYGPQEDRLAADCAELFRPRGLLFWNGGDENAFLGKKLTLAGTVYRYEKEARVSLWGNVSVFQYSDGTRAYTGLTVNGVRILLCSSGCDAAALPEEWKRADFVVTDDPPRGASALQPFVTVLSMGEDSAQQNLAALDRLGVASCATGGAGNLLIDIMPDGTITLRRNF